MAYVFPRPLKRNRRGPCPYFSPSLRIKLSEGRTRWAHSLCKVSIESDLALVNQLTSSFHHILSSTQTTRTQRPQDQHQ